GSQSFTAAGTGGIGPYSVSWTGPNGLAFIGPTITINNAQEVNAGSYAATVTDSSTPVPQTTACSGPLMVATVKPQSAEVCVGGSASFTNSVSGGTPPYTTNWSGPNNFSSNSPIITVNNAQLADAGIYWVTNSDASGLI